MPTLDINLNLFLPRGLVKKQHILWRFSSEFLNSWKRGLWAKEGSTSLVHKAGCQFSTSSNPFCALWIIFCVLLPCRHCNFCASEASECFSEVDTDMDDIDSNVFFTVFFNLISIKSIYFTCLTDPIWKMGSHFLQAGTSVWDWGTLGQLLPGVKAVQCWGCLCRELVLSQCWPGRSIRSCCKRTLFGFGVFCSPGSEPGRSTVHWAGEGYQGKEQFCWAHTMAKTGWNSTELYFDNGQAVPLGQG